MSRRIISTRNILTNNNKNLLNYLQTSSALANIIKPKPNKTGKLIGGVSIRYLARKFDSNPIRYILINNSKSNKNNKIQGFAVMKNSNNWRGKIRYIDVIGSRGAPGGGTQLMLKIINNARKNGMNQINLNSAPNITNFYTRNALGFKKNRRFATTTGFVPLSKSLRNNKKNM
jgi:hypothetical protein